MNRVDRFLLAACGVVLVVTAIRIANVSDPRDKTPFLSANDRSRWCTVRSLLEHGTYAIDSVIVDPGWDTIDKVRHRDTEGQWHFYSSKPPLYPTIMAGVCWCVQAMTGTTLSQSPLLVGRLTILALHLPVLALFFWSLIQLTREFAETSWARVFVTLTAMTGTFLTTFAVTINNHLIAAASAAVTLVCMVSIRSAKRTNWHWFFLAGVASCFTAANELPALAFLVCVAAFCVRIDLRHSLAAFLPGVVLIAVPFFMTNYMAHDSLIPAYAHTRGEGEENWYDYEGSYWREENLKGVDRGEPSRLRYTFHAIVGHHGILSLTPVWLLSIYGIWLNLRDRRELMFTTLWTALTVIVLAFYLLVLPPLQRNYGGQTSGLRWLFWLYPLWLCAMVPAVDRMSKNRWGRAITIILLIASVLSVTYSSRNPWVHPWLYQR